MGKKLLLVGGGHSDVPLIISAKKMGFYVITVGNRPDYLGHRFSDEYHMIDFSDRDSVCALARSLKVSHVCAGCNDFSALSAAFTAECLNLPGHDPYHVAETIHLKDHFRRFALKNGIPSPQAVGFSNISVAMGYLSSVNYPVIIKPVDLSGGKGINRADNQVEASEAVATAFSISRSGRIVIEEFIEGSRHGFTAILRNQKVAFHLTDNEQYFLNPYMVSGACVPGDTSPETEKILVASTEHIAELLTLQDGIFHLQFVMNQGKPAIIEVCRRAPGDLYIKLVEYATGVDYPAAIVRTSVGMDAGDLEWSGKPSFVHRHCIMHHSVGKVNSITYDQAIHDHIIDEMTLWKPGSPIHDHLTVKLGIIFLKYSNQEQMRAMIPQMQQMIRIEML